MVASVQRSLPVKQRAFFFCGAHGVGKRDALFCPKCSANDVRSRSLISIAAADLGDESFTIAPPAFNVA